MINIITMFDDIQRHIDGCECGCCESKSRRSFGVSIKECKGYALPSTNKDECVEKAILSDEVVERVYAGSPAEAREKARCRAAELGYIFLADI